ncbi:MAG: rhomboid family intramembrane serine protease [Halorubrum sp.]
MAGSGGLKRGGDEPSGDDGRSDRETPSVRGLADALSRAIRGRPAVELVLVAVPLPALLVVVAVMPGSEAWALSLSATGVFESRWTLWTAFASSFVHTDPSHLLDNVVNYWLVVAVAYPLSVIAGWQRRLLYAAVIFLLVVPLVSAWATLLAFGGALDAPAAGFSDVNSAFLGYLVVVWFAALASESAGEIRGTKQTRDVTRSVAGRATAGGVDVRWSVVVAFGSLAFVFVSPSGAGYFPPTPTVAILFATVAAVTAGFLWARTGTPRLAGLDLAAARELLYVTGASVVVAGVIGSLVIVPLGSNVFAHLAGYAVGVSTAFVWVIADA